MFLHPVTWPIPISGPIRGPLPLPSPHSPWNPKKGRCWLKKPETCGSMVTGGYWTVFWTDSWEVTLFSNKHSQRDHLPYVCLMLAHLTSSKYHICLSSMTPIEAYEATQPFFTTKHALSIAHSSIPNSNKCRLPCGRWALIHITAVRESQRASTRWTYVFPHFKFVRWVCLKMVSIPKPNGFADHYPY